MAPIAHCSKGFGRNLPLIVPAAEPEAFETRDGEPWSGDTRRTISGPFLSTVGRTRQFNGPGVRTAGSRYWNADGGRFPTAAPASLRANVEWRTAGSPTTRTSQPVTRGPDCMKAWGLPLGAGEPKRWGMELHSQVNVARPDHGANDCPTILNEICRVHTGHGG